MKTRNIKKVISIFILIGVWEIIALILNKPVLIPTPITVFFRLIKLLQDYSTYTAITYSILRIIIGFILGIVLGCLFGFLSFKSEFISSIISPIIWIMKTTPVTALILVMLVWFNTRNLSIIVCIIATTPIIYQNIILALNSPDNNLLKLDYVYNISFKKKIRMIILPQIMPYLLSSIELCAGISIKSSIAAEIIAIPKGSIGSQFYYAKTMIDQPTLISLVVILIVISVLFTKAVTHLFRIIGTNYDKML